MLFKLQQRIKCYRRSWIKRIGAYFIFQFIGPNIFQDFWFEKSIFCCGWSTGTVAILVQWQTLKNVTRISSSRGLITVFYKRFGIWDPRGLRNSSNYQCKIKRQKEGSL